MFLNHSLTTMTVLNFLKAISKSKCETFLSFFFFFIYIYTTHISANVNSVKITFRSEMFSFEASLNTGICLFFKSRLAGELKGYEVILT